MRTGVVLLAVACASFAGARPSAAFVTPNFVVGGAEIVGTYEVTGTGLDGLPDGRKDVATIERLATDVYRIREYEAGGTAECLCIRTGMHLGCGWGVLGSPIHVASYRVQNGNLDGRVLEDVTRPLARETFVVHASPDEPVFEGVFASSSAVSSTGDAYSTKLDVRARKTGRVMLYAVVITDGPRADSLQRASVGWGTFDGTHLDVAWDVADGVGVVEYSIDLDGNVLRGVWNDPWRPDEGTGTDLFVRRF